MKHIMAILLALLAATGVSAKKQPDWIKSKPSDTGFYTGIGSAPVSAPDHDRQAKENALSDLMSEIKITIENQSLLSRIDENGKYSERYTNDIRSKSKAWLEGYELVDTYNDGEQYWMYYRLDREKYARLRETRSKEASETALDLWLKANKSLKNGEFINAASLYAQGIRTLEPFGDMRLEVVADGTTMNIASELTYSLQSMFSQFSMTLTPPKMTVTPFNAEASEILVRIKSGSDNLQGIALSATIDAGSAKINVKAPTDRSGHTRISVSDVSAKPSQRHITITPLLDFDGIFNTPALETLAAPLIKMIRPGKVSVEIKDSGLKACYTISDSESANIGRQIATFINKSYFDIVESDTAADLRFDITTSFSQGNIVSGPMYDMREYFSTVTVTVTDLNSQSVVATAHIDDMRSVAPAKTSVKKARNDANRQVLKKIQKELDSQLLAAKFQRKAIERQNGTVTNDAFFYSDLDED